MQEIVLILSSIAGVATAAAVRKMPRDKNQLLSLGASSQIKNQINSLKIEKDILTKTISRLYQAENEFSKIQKFNHLKLNKKKKKLKNKFQNQSKTRLILKNQKKQKLIQLQYHQQNLDNHLN